MQSNAMQTAKQPLVALHPVGNYTFGVKDAKPERRLPADEQTTRQQQACVF